MKRQTLYEKSKSRVITFESLEKSYKSFIRLYFEWEKENKPQILKDALRQQIEKIELKMLSFK